MSKYWTDDEPQLGWTDWRPVHAPTCRKGGCPAAVAEESEWCPKHLDQVISQRASTGPQQRVGGQEPSVNKHTMSISRAFGKVVVTLHGDVDADLLRRTLTALAEDQRNLHLITIYATQAHLTGTASACWSSPLSSCGGRAGIWS